MKKMQDGGRRHTLGLDIGVASLGWAVIEDGDGTSGGNDSGRVVAVGSHLFEAGTDGTQSDIAGGKGTPKGQQRRTARQARRTIWRRVRRMRLALRAPVKAGLLPTPPNDLKTPAEIDAYVKSIDAELLRTMQDRSHRGQQVWTYALRARAAVGEVSSERHPQPRFDLVAARRPAPQKRRGPRATGGVCRAFKPCAAA